MDLKILSMASALARHGAARHSVVAENIANADTPGYQAKDIKPFAETPIAQRGSGDFAARDTRPGHVAGDASNIAETVFETVKREATSPNGNGVSLEAEMLKSVEAQGRHDLAVTIYQKSIDILRLSLGKSR
ncbi:MAG: FlgB family protein [Pseudomonadota bacterium]